MDNWLSWVLSLGGIGLGTVSALCAAFFPFLILGALGAYLYRRSKMAQAARAAARSWSRTPGTVLASSTRVSHMGKSRTVLPVVVYQYQVDGQPYTGKRIRAGDQFGRAFVSGEAETIRDRYPAGSQVTVYYDPAQPSASALEI